MFLPHEADVIKGIPLNSHLPVDKLIWAETPNGKFSVRSAYGVAVRLSKSDNKGISSDRSQLRLFWKRIWNLPLPHKVRHFAWRACRDILPTKVNLMRRNVVKDPFCDECKMEVESTGHLFWSCPRAREVWSCSKVVVKPCHARVHSFQDLLWDMVVGESFDVDVSAKVVCMAWAIWHNKNETRNGGKRRNGKEIMSWVSQYLEEYKSANECLGPTTVPHVGSDTWNPPPVHDFKVNVDGAVFKGQKSAGVGVIIRDDKGRLEAALSKKINEVWHEDDDKVEEVVVEYYKELFTTSHPT